MSKSTYWTQSVAQLCLEVGEEDGVNPRVLKKKTACKPKSHKDLQLCKEARRVFSLVLSDAINRTLLHGLQVLSVTPELDGQVLRITVGYDGVNLEVTDSEVIAELKQMQGVFRCALAQAVNRRHTPRLTFVYAGLMQIKQGGG